MKTKVKITVVKREYYQDLADRFLANPQKGKCTIFYEGQEFLSLGKPIIASPMKMISAFLRGMSSKARSMQRCRAVIFTGKAG